MINRNSENSQNKQKELIKTGGQNNVKASADVNPGGTAMRKMEELLQASHI